MSRRRDKGWRKTAGCCTRGGTYAGARRAVDRDKPWVKKLVATYESDDVRKYIDTRFKGVIVPAF